jgi:hypothetical protein
MSAESFGSGPGLPDPARVATNAATSATRQFNSTEGFAERFD